MLAGLPASGILVSDDALAAFVAAGFEHSIANMFFLPIAIVVREFAPAEFWAATGSSPEGFASLHLGSLVENLVPVTLGNIVGGALFVAAVYHFVYLRLGPDGQPAISPFRRSWSLRRPSGAASHDERDVTGR